jgi:cell wall-associated NlpC family hydrolase
VVGSCTGTLLLGGPVLGGSVAVAAVPPPPPNPSDTEIERGKASRDGAASRVGQLAGELAAAESKLVELQASVALRAEEANKALVDLDTALAKARTAAREAETARNEATLAGTAIEDAYRSVDQFAAASFRQGSMVGSVAAYVDAKGPRDLLARSQLLNAIGGSQLHAIEALRNAQVEKANKDSAARAALAAARTAQTLAEEAKRFADRAQAEAEAAQQGQAAHAAQLEAAKAEVERQLAEAQATVTGLEAQRVRYQEWAAAKQQEEIEGAESGSVPEISAGGSVRAVIERALSQVGVPYAWGGGNSSGPTRGIRDGGIADSHGDFRKVGFDCSGLMIYAFAAAGVELSHYSGYQASAGRRVPLSQKQPGDLLFWATAGRIHHVALYIGNGRMVEAPYSGSSVRVTSVRYGGILPQATRLL